VVDSNKKVGEKLIESNKFGTTLVGIHYNVIRVYPLFGWTKSKRSKFSDLENFGLKNALAMRSLRVNGLNTNRSAIKVVF